MSTIATPVVAPLTVQEIQVILDEIHYERAFQVATIIEKIHPSWKDFKNYLKHKRKEMSIEDLIVRLRIEKNNKGSKKGVPD